MGTAVNDERDLLVRDVAGLGTQSADAFFAACVMSVKDRVADAGIDASRLRFRTATLMRDQGPLKPATSWPSLAITREDEADFAGVFCAAEPLDEGASRLHIGVAGGGTGSEVEKDYQQLVAQSIDDLVAGGHGCGCHDGGCCGGHGHDEGHECGCGGDCDCGHDHECDDAHEYTHDLDGGCGCGCHHDAAEPEPRGEHRDDAWARGVFAGTHEDDLVFGDYVLHGGQWADAVRLQEFFRANIMALYARALPVRDLDQVMVDCVVFDVPSKDGAHAEHPAVVVRRLDHDEWADVFVMMESTPAGVGIIYGFTRRATDAFMRLMAGEEPTEAEREALLPEHDFYGIAISAIQQTLGVGDGGE